MIVKILSLNLENNKYYNYNDINSMFIPLIGYNYDKNSIYTHIIADLNAVNLENGKYIFLHYLSNNYTLSTT